LVFPGNFRPRPNEFPQSCFSRALLAFILPFLFFFWSGVFFRSGFFFSQSFQRFWWGLSPFVTLRLVPRRLPSFFFFFPTLGIFRLYFFPLARTFFMTQVFRFFCSFFFFPGEVPCIFFCNFLRFHFFFGCFGVSFSPPRLPFPHLHPVFPRTSFIFLLGQHFFPAPAVSSSFLSLTPFRKCFFFPPLATLSYKIFPPRVPFFLSEISLSQNGFFSAGAFFLPPSFPTPVWFSQTREVVENPLPFKSCSSLSRRLLIRRSFSHFSFFSGPFSWGDPLRFRCFFFFRELFPRHFFFFSRPSSFYSPLSSRHPPFFQLVSSDFSTPPVPPFFFNLKSPAFLLYSSVDWPYFFFFFFRPSAPPWPPFFFFFFLTVRGLFFFCLFP